MSKSKCQNKLDDMTAERDHWKAKAREKDEQIENLQRALYEFQIKSEIIPEGINSMAKKTADVLLQRDNEIKALREQLESYSPINAMYNDYRVSGFSRYIDTDGNWQKAIVEAVYVFRVGDDIIYPLRFQGVIDNDIDMMHSIINQAYLNASQFPLPQDHASIPPALDILTDHDITYILWELSLVSQSPDVYKTRRLELFRELWQKVDTPEYKHTKDTFRSNLFKFVDRTFSNYAKRTASHMLLFEGGGEFVPKIGTDKQKIK